MGISDTDGPVREPDVDNELVREEVRRASVLPRPVFYLVWVGAALIMAAGVLFFIGSAVPWKPFWVYEYRVTPNLVCPGEDINVQIKRSVKPPWPPGGSYTVVVRSSWQNVDTAKSTPITETTLNQEEAQAGMGYGTDWVESPLIREAPTEPGRWRLLGTYAVSGKVFIIPRSYRVEEVSPPLLSTLPADAPACK